jgi:hypothetical protein
MSAQIFPFPTATPGHALNGATSGGMIDAAAVTPEQYARVAARIIENAAQFGMDPMVLAGAIVATLETTAALATEIKASARALIAKAEEDHFESLSTPEVPGYCDPANEFRGSKYDRDRDVASIAKLLRADIKAARKDGTLVLPADTKVSVTIDRFSMGCSVHVRIYDLPAELMYNAPGTELTNGYPYSGGSHPYRQAAEARIKELMDAYLRDNSDSQSDYSDVNFYGSVSTGNS